MLAIAGLPAQSAAPEARTLVNECLRAETENTKVAANWLGREDIRRFTIHGRKRKLTGWQTFEASFLAGRPYYRKIAINGKPLSRSQIEREDALMGAELRYRQDTPRAEQRSNDRRTGFGLKTILYSHDFQVLREDAWHGRKTWVVEGILRSDAPEPMTLSDGGLSSDVLLWVDEETHLPVREELTVRKTWAHMESGSTILLEFSFDNGLRLISKIVLRGMPNEKGLFHETEQTYSNYRKFGAESQIIVHPEP
jgi:hypothetical protein